MEDLLRLPSPSTTPFPSFPTLAPRRLRRCAPRRAPPPSARLAASPTRPVTDLPASPEIPILLGADLLAVDPDHPELLAPYPDLRATVRILHSVGLPPPELRRAVGMCPEILSAGPSAVSAALVFLLREAGVPPGDLPRVIHQRPRLLSSDVALRLRPALRFLQFLGVQDTARHAALLCFSVEERLLPRLDFLTGAGLSPRDARTVARRFPDIFRYNVEDNLQPKLEFLTKDMGRELRELREFPEYFSYSLEGRIRPRHRLCRERGVLRLPLPHMLRPNDGEFRARLDVCTGSSPPSRSSPLSGCGRNPPAAPPS